MCQAAGGGGDGGDGEGHGDTSDVEGEYRQLVKGKKGNMVVVEEHG